MYTYLSAFVLSRNYMLRMVEVKPRIFSSDETVTDLLGIHILYLLLRVAIASLGRACECEEKFSNVVESAGAMHTATCRRHLLAPVTHYDGSCGFSWEELTITCSSVG